MEGSPKIVEVGILPLSTVTFRVSFLEEQNSAQRGEEYRDHISFNSAHSSASAEGQENQLQGRYGFNTDVYAPKESSESKRMRPRCFPPLIPES